LRGTVDIGPGISVTTATTGIGYTTGDLATVNLGGYWQNTDDLFIGSNYDGLLNIATGGTLASRTSVLGLAAGASGTAIVSGLWQNTDVLLVGGMGNGTLDIDSTGKLITGNFYGANDAGSEAHVTIGGALQTNTAYVGDSGAATIDILGGGVMTTATTAAYNIVLGNSEDGVGTINVKDGGSLYSSSQIRVGGAASGTGILNIESGGLVRTGSGVYAGHNNGYGVINIATGGTFSIGAGSLYVGGNTGAAYSASYGEVNVDGFAQTGGDGTAFAYVGYSGIGVVNVGPTGFIKTGYLDVGREYTGSGTITIAGRWETTAVGNQDSYIGHAGEGTVIIESGGYLASIGQRYFYIGAGVGDLNQSVGIMTIEEGGVFIRRQSTGNAYTAIGGHTTYATQNRASGTVTVNGLFDVDKALRVGYNNGDAYLYIGQTGTLYAGVLDLTYIDCKAIATTTIAGEMHIRGLDSGAAAATIHIGRYGYATMHVTETGTVTATAQIVLGEGAMSSGAPSDYFTSGSYGGSLKVDGYMSTDTYVRVGNKTKGSLDITKTGTMIAGTFLRLNESGTSVITTATANVAGYLGVGTILTVGYGPNSRAHLNIENGGHVKVGTDFINGYGVNATGRVTIADTGTLIVGSGYSQNAQSTLEITLENRPSTSPFINIERGGAAISGTLIVNLSGSAAAAISYTGNGEGKATDLSGTPIFRAPSGITGDFTFVDIIVGGSSLPITGLPDYIRSGGMRVNEGGPIDTRYDIGYGLAWRSGLSEAHGDFTVEEGKTFDVNVQLADRPGFTFTSGWDGKSLHKKGPGTLILSVENTYTGDTIVDSGTLRFTGPSRYSFGALVNNSVIDFYETGTNNARIGGYRTLSASSLSGNNGVFRMGVDLTTGASDRLIIAGDASGTYRLLITGTAAAMPKGDEPTPTFVTIGGVNNTSITAEGEIIGGDTFSGNFDYGHFKYEVQMIGNKVVIVNTGLDPHVFTQIRGVGAQSLLWFDQLGNVSSRFGELRAPRDDGSGFDIWARGHASGASIGGGSSDMPDSDVDIWGAEIGFDHTWQFDDQRATAGIYVGTGNASQKFERPDDALSDSSGESDMLGIGVYGSWLTESGWFANVTASMSQYKNSFDSVDGSDNHTTADYKDHGFGVTVEGGHRFAVSTNGWFIEPSVQGAVVRLSRASYLTAGNNELNVNGSDTTINRLRGTMRVGRAWQTEHVGWMQIAGRIGAMRERSSGGEIVISSSDTDRWRPNLDGNRYEIGASWFWQPFDRGQLYFDYEYSGGDNFKKPWAISLGFRLSL
jgi:outer membrane autotransporter protein